MIIPAWLKSLPQAIRDSRLLRATEINDQLQETPCEYCGETASLKLDLDVRFLTVMDVCYCRFYGQLALAEQLDWRLLKTAKWQAVFDVGSNDSFPNYRAVQVDTERLPISRYQKLLPASLDMKLSEHRLSMLAHKCEICGYAMRLERREGTPFLELQVCGHKAPQAVEGVRASVKGQVEQTSDDVFEIQPSEGIPFPSSDYKLFVRVTNN